MSDSPVSDAKTVMSETVTASQKKSTESKETPKVIDLDDANPHCQRWHEHIRDCKEILRIVEPLEVAGRITKLTGLVMESVGIQLPIGSACYVPLPEGRRVEAEVVGFDGDRMLLMPQGSVMVWCLVPKYLHWKCQSRYLSHITAVRHVTRH